MVAATVPSAASATYSHEACVPSAGIDAYDETVVVTPQQTIHHPAVPETFTTVHHDAVTHEVEGDAPWWNWSPNKYQGPFDGPPSFPTDERGTWTKHDNGGGPEQGTFGTFNTSNNDNGRASWFHREHGEVTVVVDKEAWDEKVSNKDGKDAYDEIIPAVTKVVHHDAVPATTCKIDWPTPQVTDPCGLNNATWVLPVGDARINWLITDDGRLIGEVIADGFTWPNGSLINSWGTAPDSGVACPPEPIVISPEVPTFTDACGTKLDGYLVPADVPGITYDWTDIYGAVTITAHLVEGYVWDSPLPEGYETGEDGSAVWKYTFTDEPCPTEEPTPTPTPSATPTPEPTPTPTTPVVTPTPEPSTSAPSATPTPKPSEPTATVTPEPTETPVPPSTQRRVPPLAETGGDVAPILAIAGVAVLAGLVLLLLRRRKSVS
jgi:LPXTG-motif cell wall-anchored protein